MRRILISSLLLGLVAGPAQALTQPGDIVGVYLFDESKTDAFGMPAESRYHKKWSEIKLSAKSKELIAKHAKELEKSGEKFRVAFIQVVLTKGVDTVEAAAFYGEWGTVVMKDFVSNSGSNVCLLSFNSSGGFAGVTEKPCRRE